MATDKVRAALHLVITTYHAFPASVPANLRRTILDAERVLASEVRGSTSRKVRRLTDAEVQQLTDAELYAYRKATAIADDVAFILARAPELASEVPEVPTRADVARLAQRFRERTPNTLTDERLFWSNQRAAAAALLAGLPDVDVAMLRRESTWPPNPIRVRDIREANERNNRRHL